MALETCLQGQTFVPDVDLPFASLPLPSLGWWRLLGAPLKRRRRTVELQEARTRSMAIPKHFAQMPNKWLVPSPPAGPRQTPYPRHMLYYPMGASICVLWPQPSPNEPRSAQMVAGLTFTAWVGRTLKGSRVEVLVVASGRGPTGCSSSVGVGSSTGAGVGAGVEAGAGGSVAPSEERIMISVCSRSKGVGTATRPENTMESTAGDPVHIKGDKKKRFGMNESSA